MLIVLGKLASLGISFWYFLLFIAHDISVFNLLYFHHFQLLFLNFSLIRWLFTFQDRKFWALNPLAQPWELLLL